jgi:hypothetical protein
MKSTNLFGFLALVFVLSFAPATEAQVQTTNQCLATTRARAGLTLSKAEMQSLCENNSDDVVNCVITMMQGYRFSGNLSQSVKDCRKQFINSYY